MATERSQSHSEATRSSTLDISIDRQDKIKIDRRKLTEIDQRTHSRIDRRRAYTNRRAADTQDSRVNAKGTDRSFSIRL